ncbi:MAG TPA: peptidoglycan DD-metalloendopeptidase family protein [Nitrolancea sp.]|nr:peptidoglycan DD-metalloendopeptidase family protein [Nitrolancea sp.]
MGRDFNDPRGPSLEAPSRYGWRPDTSPEEPAEGASLAAVALAATAVLDAPVASSLDRAPDIPLWRPIARPLPRHRARRFPGKLPLHLLVLATIVAVVLGGGYWSRAAIPAPAARPAGTSALRLGELPTTVGPTSDSGPSVLAAATSGGRPDVMTGYLSQFSSAVIPNQLRVRTIVAEGSESIGDLATQTGLRIDTLLWANGLTDPTQELPAGTQVRVPPVDGMLHIVHDGDTLESIAARYQVDVTAITGYGPNNVQTTADLVPYRLLMVPGGTMPTRDKVETYVVRDGDTLATIAQFFGVHPNTILWANSLPDGDLIFPGQHLAILPADGVMVTVKAGDTVESLAATYSVEPKAIRDYPGNGLGAAGTLRVDQLVMIPGGKPPKPPEPPPAPAPAAPAAPSVAQSQPAAAPAQHPASGRFIWPTSGTITQYYGPTSLWLEPAYLGYAHFHQGLDIANGMYTPIVAAASGTVAFAGWTNVGYGYAVQIDHGNGLVTWYGHMAQMPAVHSGQWVEQGQYLGPMGSTGASTGAHLHFGVLKNGVWDNPLNYLP